MIRIFSLMVTSFAFAFILTEIRIVVECSLSNFLVPDPTRLDISYEVEYETFEREFFSSIHATRTKRFIYLNTDTTMAVALLFGVPLTLILPSLSNMFNKWRRKRSVREIDGDGFNDFVDDPMIQPHLDRINTYFELVDIPEHFCQLRAICEFGSDPEKYYPLSKMILSKIQNFNSKESSLNDVSLFRNLTAPSLLNIYTEAANKGMFYGAEECQKQFGHKCRYSMDQLLNIPSLRFWSAMQSLLQLSFKDAESC